MHPAVNAAFDQLCRRYSASGAVIEIGATPTADTLLNLPALTRASRRIGVNIDPPSRIGDADILQLNAHDMAVIGSGSFDLALCNSTLEHDPMFWLTLGEIRRVLRPGGIAMIGVPGYVAHRGPGPTLGGLAARLWQPPLPGARIIAAAAASTATLHVHNYPGDYYRFSEQAMVEVLLGGLDVLDLQVIMHPPRILGVGRKGE